LRGALGGAFVNAWPPKSRNRGVLIEDNNGLTKAAAVYTFALIRLTLEIMPFQDAKVLSEFTTVTTNPADEVGETSFA
jgi:hypothetical protein